MKTILTVLILLCFPVFGFAADKTIKGEIRDSSGNCFTRAIPEAIRPRLVIRWENWSRSPGQETVRPRSGLRVGNLVQGEITGIHLQRLKRRIFMRRIFSLSFFISISLVSTVLAQTSDPGACRHQSRNFQQRPRPDREAPGRRMRREREVRGRDAAARLSASSWEAPLETSKKQR